MKLLMIGWELPPYNSGGLGVATFNMMKALARRGDLNIKFILPYKAPHREAEKYFNIISASEIPPRMDESGNYLLYGAYAGVCSICLSRECAHSAKLGADLISQTKNYAREIVKLIKKDNLQPDIIHAHDWLTLPAATAAKNLTKKPMVVHVHATEFERSGGSHGNPLIWEVEYNGFRAADRIFAVSRHTKDIIVREYDIPEDKVEVVYNAFDEEDLPASGGAKNNYLYAKKMKSLGYTIVGANSRLTVMKGLPYLMEAAALAMSRNPKIILILISDGEMRDQLIELAADLGISDRVIFAGFVRGARWREFYELIDIFAMPSMFEPFGLTALEAAHYNTAVLLSKTCGVGEILSSVMRFDYWDTWKLADEIINISLSPALHDELRDGIKREYMRISWDDVAAKLTREYNKLIFLSRKKAAQNLHLNLSKSINRSAENSANNFAENSQNVLENVENSAEKFENNSENLTNNIKTTEVNYA